MKSKGITSRAWFPSLQKAEITLRISESLFLRNLEELRSMGDTCRRLYDASNPAIAKEARLALPTPRFVVAERLHALTWMFSDKDWEDIDVDVS